MNRPVSVALVHSHYRQRGGEDVVVEQELELLQARGNEVSLFARDNSSISGDGSVRVALETIWSRRAVAELSEFLSVRKPDIVHVHNTFPLLSPAVHHAIRRSGRPCVMTLHNFRLLCPSATFFRDGRPCEDCISYPFAVPAILHACYRESRAATTAVATMNAAHRVLGTWHRQISAYVALTEFARDRFAAGGLPKDRIHVRSNYVADPRARARSLNDPNARAIYVGRISSEKGVRILTEAWEDIDAKLDVYGDGPLLPELRKNSARNICFHGAVSRETAVRALRDAAFLVVPSICYESFPLVVLEAFSVGVPVLASRLGSLEEIVSHGTTGMHFAPGQPGALARAARELLANPSLRAALGANARLTYEERYTPDRAYARLMDIYDAAFRESRQRNLRGASPSAS